MPICTPAAERRLLDAKRELRAQFVELYGPQPKRPPGRVRDPKGVVIVDNVSKDDSGRVISDAFRDHAEDVAAYSQTMTQFVHDHLAEKLEEMAETDVFAAEALRLVKVG